MMAGTFAAVSASDGSYTLGDLSVSGYEAPIYDEDEGETQEGTGVLPEGYWRKAYLSDRARRRLRRC